MVKKRTQEGVEITEVTPRLVEDYPVVYVRVTPSLKARIKKAATENHRTMNGEIVAALEKHFI